MLFGAVLYGPTLASGNEGITYTIRMSEAGYEPANITIRVGDTVGFANVGLYGRWPASNIHPTHSVYPGTHIDKCHTSDGVGMFDACTEMMPGETFYFTFHEPGNWRYHDHITPDFNGVIVVEGEKEVVEKSFWKRFVEFLSNKWAELVQMREVSELANTTSVQDWNIVETVENKTELELLLRTFGAEAVMSRLLEETGGGTVIDCHNQAHEVGRIAYLVYGAEVFETGDESCHSGFYHGAMESFISDTGTTNIATNIEQLCDVFGTRFGLFECLHGVGHGVLAYEDYDLLRALDVCGELSTEFAQTSCYGGVFMENVVVGQGLGSTPGHTTSWLRYDDPHYPCNVLDANSVRAEQCYLMQTSWMLQLANHDFETVAPMCEDAPANLRSTCYISFGRDAAGHSLREPAAILEKCAYIESNQSDYNACVYGAVNVILDFWGAKHSNQAQEFCAQINNQEAREECNGIIEFRLIDIFQPRT